MTTTATPSDAFFRDLRAAVATWRVAWWMPVISVLLSASLWANGAERLVADASDPDTAANLGAFPLVLLAVSLFELGWFGAEREIHRRVWTGEGDPAAGLGRLTASYVGRFLRLGLLVGWPVLFVPALFEAGDLSVLSVVVFTLNLVIYVLLTFVTPDLAYRSARVGPAVVEGVGMLVREARTLRWHVLLPPALVVTLGAAVGSAGVPELLRFVVGVVASLAGLATKGAIARRWLIVHTERFAEIERQELAGTRDPGALPWSVPPSS